MQNETIFILEDKLKNIILKSEIDINYLFCGELISIIKKYGYDVVKNKFNLTDTDLDIIQKYYDATYNDAVDFQNNLYNAKVSLIDKKIAKLEEDERTYNELHRNDPPLDKIANDLISKIDVELEKLENKE